VTGAKGAKPGDSTQSKNERITPEVDENKVGREKDLRYQMSGISRVLGGRYWGLGRRSGMAGAKGAKQEVQRKSKNERITPEVDENKSRRKRVPVKSVRHQTQGSDIDSKFEIAEERGTLGKNKGASGDVRENKGRAKRRCQLSSVRCGGVTGGLGVGTGQCGRGARGPARRGFRIPDLGWAHKQ